MSLCTSIFILDKIGNVCSQAVVTAVSQSSQIELLASAKLQPQCLHIVFILFHLFSNNFFDTVI